MNKHHNDRIRTKRKSLSERFYGHVHPMNIETFTSCSCWMCGNPRKFMKGSDKFTIQEKRENEKHYRTQDN